ncbi:head processing protein [Pantoea sp. CCBC3-3-1]|uniref:head processing protein n=1 Tax=Pantoea sp. CCBC3-3-1 TaxID=2490851 RepID=UPI0011BDB583|nr:head processing protein [Pantoea sp. CCBC3-3-1]
MTIERKILKTHTDRFALFDKVRKGKQNNRNYMLEAVRAMFNNPETQEGLRLGELYGYYGHSRRQLAGSMELPETAVVMVEGKPVVLDNIPSNRTIELSVDDNGVVTHTEEIFDTPTGRIVASMLESRAGGWSWVTTGRDSPAVSIPKAFYGFDYVTMPNFISKDHPAAMHESAESRTTAMTEALVGSGFDNDSAANIVSHYDKLSHHEVMIESVLRVEQLETASLEAAGELLAKETQLAETTSMLESLKAEKVMYESAADARKQKLLAALDKLPIFTNSSHSQALANMQTDADVEIVTALFESLARIDTSTLPMDVMAESVHKTAVQHQAPDAKSYISFSDETPNFGAY